MMKISIQKRILGSMLLISMIPILLLAYFTLNISQKNMQNQLIQTRILGMNWMNDKLTTELGGYADLFYSFEINKKIKQGLISWVIGNNSIDSILPDIRNNFEDALNTDANILSVEIYNYLTGDGYIATRKSFQNGTWDNMDTVWNSRDTALQSNIVVRRDGSDFVVMHQINEFTTGKKIAVLVIRLNKHSFADTIQKNIEEGESAILFNDEDLILAELGNYQNVPVQNNYIDIMQRIKEEPSGIFAENNHFYFYESINKGKLNLLYIVPDQLIRNQLKDTVTIAFIIMIFSLLAASLLSVLFSEIISKPIITLSKKMQTTDIHNFAADVPINRNDEIGLLQESFENMMTRNQELVTREYQREIEKRNAQLRALQAQINPHFLYNTLQVIGGMSLSGKSEHIYSVVTALSDILRYAISFERESVTLEQEITYLKSYISIQNNRFDHRLQFETEIAPRAMQSYIPKLILQPLVENCLEHGLNKKNEDWKIQLNAYEDTTSDSLIITVSDNGLGMDPAQLDTIRSSLASSNKETLSSSSHIGLSNVHSRIRIMSGPEYGLSIQSNQNEGTTITIKTKLLGKKELCETENTQQY